LTDVLKFGGASVGTAERAKEALSRHREFFE
jgi:aspartokinase